MPSKRSNPKAQGNIIYHHNAPDLAEKRKGKRMRLQSNHVEWVSVRGPVSNKTAPIQSSIAKLFFGRVKFRGKTYVGPKGEDRIKRGPIKDAVIKIYNDKIAPRKLTRLKEVIKRLKKSSVRHPLMEFLEIDHNGQKTHALVMEAFVKKLKSKVQTIFTLSDYFFKKLDINNNSEDVRIFRQMVVQTAKLAQARLAIEKEYTSQGKATTRAFEIVRTNKGVLVYVQGVDALRLMQDPKRAWQISSKRLLAAVSMNPKNARFATEIIRKTGKRYGLEKTPKKKQK